MSSVTPLGQAREFNWARWLQVVLVASLAVNMLVVGAVFGGAWMARQRPEPGISVKAAVPAMALMGPVGKFIGTLPPARRTELREVIVQHQTTATQFNSSMLTIRREVADAILAAPFDKLKFEAALKRMYETEASARVANVSANSAFLEHLTDSERAAFVKLLNWPGLLGANKDAELPAEAKAP